MAVIDLYSGIGGWTLGFKMAGVEVLSSYEWWKDANLTHNKNFGSEHSERNIRTLSLSDLPDPELISFVVGSPPCTQFSLANRGGKGDIQDGLVDIQKFLEVVEYLNPRYWAMENVPRVAGILKKEIAKGGSLERFAPLFGDIRIYKASDFGVPQDRKRMIAGRFPFDLFESYSSRIPKVNLGDVIAALNLNPIEDPIYNIQLEPALVTDHILEPNLSVEEERINRESKTHHPVYNKMNFPDRLDRPSRTVTALCTRVSRESIIIEDSKKNIRRLTLRERGSIQSFPINYQFFSKNYSGKIKMIGNAVPPLLTFYIAQSMQGICLSDLTLAKDVHPDRLSLGNELAISHKPDNEGAKFSKSRSFRLAIPGLRFGSGVRFELKNVFDNSSKEVKWQVSFFYGSSKNIKAHKMDYEAFKNTLAVLDLNHHESLLELISEYIMFTKTLNSVNLQRNWSNLDRSLMGPIELVDKFAEYARIFIGSIKDDEPLWKEVYKFIDADLKNEEGKLENKKLLDNSVEVFTGILLGSGFNSMIANDSVDKISTINLPTLQNNHLYC